MESKPDCTVGEGNGWGVNIMAIFLIRKKKPG
jgi:hypothetical protein